MFFKNTILLNVSHVFGMLFIYKMLFSCEILPVAYRFFIILLDFTQLPRCKNIITALRLYRYHAKGTASPWGYCTIPVSISFSKYENTYTEPS